ncbi:MAG: transcriptional regulator, partial [Mycobacterium sp.]|nr:transcriptional regulator [Mycobacterium sp.]
MTDAHPEPDPVLDVGQDLGSDLGIDVAHQPEMEDSELGAVLEALLLVVDTPVTV